MSDKLDEINIPPKLRAAIRDEIQRTSEQQLNDLWMVVHSLKDSSGGAAPSAGAAAPASEEFAELKSTVADLQTLVEASHEDLEAAQKVIAQQQAVEKSLTDKLDQLEKRFKGLRKKVGKGAVAGDSGEKDVPAFLRESLETHTSGLTELADEIENEAAERKKLQGHLEALEQRLTGRLTQVEDSLLGRVTRVEGLGAQIATLDGRISANYETLDGKLVALATALEGRLKDFEARVLRRFDEQDGSREAPARTGAGVSAFDVSDETLNAIATDFKYDLSDLIKVVLKNRADELMLKNGAIPMAVLSGNLVPIGNQVLTSDDCRRLILRALPLDKREALMGQQEVEHSIILQGARFRASAYLERSGVSASFRRLASLIPSLDDLGLPRQVELLSLEEKGLILVTGGSGAGKSNTLAAILSSINQHRSVRVITVEDPIEFEFQDDKAFITQREIGTDTRSFAEAVRHALRQHPQVLVLSDIPDAVTARYAMKGAESGILVLAGLAADGVVASLEKFAALFSSDERAAGLHQASKALQAIVSQKLLPRMDGQDLVPATEMMINGPVIRTYVQDGLFGLVEPIMERGESGMHTLKQSLAELVKAGKITEDLAAVTAHSTPNAPPVERSRVKPTGSGSGEHASTPLPPPPAPLQPPPASSLQPPPAAPPPLGPPPAAPPQATRPPLPPPPAVPEAPAQPAAQPPAAPVQPKPAGKGEGDNEALLGWL